MRKKIKINVVKKPCSPNMDTIYEKEYQGIFATLIWLRLKALHNLV